MLLCPFCAYMVRLTYQKTVSRNGLSMTIKSFSGLYRIIFKCHGFFYYIGICCNNPYGKKGGETMNDSEQ